MKDLSISEMAELIEVSPSTYSGYEHGYRKPNLDKLVKIIEVLDIDANYLLKDKYTEFAYIIE